MDMQMRGVLRIMNIGSLLAVGVPVALAVIGVLSWLRFTPNGPRMLAKLRTWLSAARREREALRQQVERLQAEVNELKERPVPETNQPNYPIDPSALERRWAELEEAQRQLGSRVTDQGNDFHNRAEALEANVETLRGDVEHAAAAVTELKADVQPLRDVASQYIDGNPFPTIEASLGAAWDRLDDIVILMSKTGGEAANDRSPEAYRIREFAKALERVQAVQGAGAQELRDAREAQMARLAHLLRLEQDAGDPQERANGSTPPS
jgi:hypothetical protein